MSQDTTLHITWNYTSLSRASNFGWGTVFTRTTLSANRMATTVTTVQVWSLGANLFVKWTCQHESEHSTGITRIKGWYYNLRSYSEKICFCRFGGPAFFIAKAAPALLSAFKVPMCPVEAFFERAPKAVRSKAFILWPQGSPCPSFPILSQQVDKERVVSCCFLCLSRGPRMWRDATCYTFQSHTTCLPDLNPENIRKHVNAGATCWGWYHEQVDNIPFKVQTWRGPDFHTSKAMSETNQPNRKQREHPNTPKNANHLKASGKAGNAGKWGIYRLSKNPGWAIYQWLMQD